MGFCSLLRLLRTSIDQTRGIASPTNVEVAETKRGWEQVAKVLHPAREYICRRLPIPPPTQLDEGPEMIWADECKASRRHLRCVDAAVQFCQYYTEEACSAFTPKQTLEAKMSAASQIHTFLMVLLREPLAYLHIGRGGFGPSGRKIKVLSETAECAAQVVEALDRSLCLMGAAGFLLDGFTAGDRLDIASNGDNAVLLRVYGVYWEYYCRLASLGPWLFSVPLSPEYAFDCRLVGIVHVLIDGADLVADGNEGPSGKYMHPAALHKAIAVLECQHDALEEGCIPIIKLRSAYYRTLLTALIGVILNCPMLSLQKRALAAIGSIIGKFEDAGKLAVYRYLWHALTKLGPREEPEFLERRLNETFDSLNDQTSLWRTANIAGWLVDHYRGVLSSPAGRGSAVLRRSLPDFLSIFTGIPEHVWLEKDGGTDGQFDYPRNINVSQLNPILMAALNLIRFALLIKEEGIGDDVVKNLESGYLTDVEKAIESNRESQEREKVMTDPTEQKLQKEIEGGSASDRMILEERHDASVASITLLDLMASVLERNRELIAQRRA